MAERRWTFSWKPVLVTSQNGESVDLDRIRRTVDSTRLWDMLVTSHSPLTGSAHPGRPGPRSCSRPLCRRTCGVVDTSPLCPRFFLGARGCLLGWGRPTQPKVDEPVQQLEPEGGAQAECHRREQESHHLDQPSLDVPGEPPRVINAGG